MKSEWPKFALSKMILPKNVWLKCKQSNSGIKYPPQQHYYILLLRTLLQSNTLSRTNSWSRLKIDDNDKYISFQQIVLGCTYSCRLYKHSGSSCFYLNISLPWSKSLQGGCKRRCHLKSRISVNQYCLYTEKYDLYKIDHSSFMAKKWAAVFLFPFVIDRGFFKLFAQPDLFVHLTKKFSLVVLCTVSLHNHLQLQWFLTVFALANQSVDLGYL